MNSDQIASAVRGLLKWAGGALAAHGMTKAGAFFNAEDVIGLIITIVGFVLSHNWHANNSGSGTIAGTATKVGAIVLLIGLAIGMPGCTTGNARLEQGGAYAPVEFAVTTNASGVVATNVIVLQQPDYAFFEVEAAFNTAASAVQGIFKFERDNRAMLWKLDPNIKRTLDGMRPVAWQVIQRYTAARAAYIANPIPANMSTLQQLSAQIQALLAAAQEAAKTPAQ